MKFQFLIVRLRPCVSNVSMTHATFQFLIVRLRQSEKRRPVNAPIVSIPNSTIKTMINDYGLHKADVSIPNSTIKTNAG